MLQNTDWNCGPQLWRRWNTAETNDNTNTSGWSQLHQTTQLWYSYRSAIRRWHLLGGWKLGLPTINSPNKGHLAYYYKRIWLYYSFLYLFYDNYGNWSPKDELSQCIPMQLNWFFVAFHYQLHRQTRSEFSATILERLAFIKVAITFASSCFSLLFFVVYWC